MAATYSKPINAGVASPAQSHVATRASVLPVKTIQTLLRFTFGLVPIVAGLDKFTNFLTTWESYLSPLATRVLPVSPAAFMGIVGVVEVIAGIITLARPRIGGYIVMAWLIAIALNLITTGHYFDVAVRDLVMAIGAFSLASLSGAIEDRREA